MGMTKRQILGILLIVGSISLLCYVFFFHDWQGSIDSSDLLPDKNPYAKRDWDQHRDAALNISVFAFRDRNRNGEYDTQDFPMASVMVVLTRPDGSIRQKRSNINGYTNFTMDENGSDKDITISNKTYRFDLKPPPGWKVTTANSRQITRFLKKQGAVAGLIAEHPPTVIGLAPDLYITSRIVAYQAGQHQLQVLNPAGESLPVDIGDDGSFVVTTYPGKWQLLLSDSVSGQQSRKNVVIKDAPVALAGIDFTDAAFVPAMQQVEQDFEYQNRSIIDKIPKGNLGLGWDYLLAIDNQHYQGPGYVNVLTSGAMVGYNSSGHPVTISTITPGKGFDFIGAYFAAAWPASEGESLLVEAWRGSQRVGQEQVALSYLGPVWFQADYRDIDRLTLTSEHYWQFVTDDMQFRLPLDAAVIPPSIQVEGVPDLNQMGLDLGLPNDGASFCGPVAASNSLAWLSGQTNTDFQQSLVTTLASDTYMAADESKGTTVNGFLRGIKRFAKEQWGGYRRLEYSGWSRTPKNHSIGTRPDINRLASGINNQSAVWLNIGWYQKSEDDYHRQGGHWVTLTGVSPDHIVIHDSGEWAGSSPQSHRVGFRPIKQGTLHPRKNLGFSIAAEGYLVLEDSTPRPQSELTPILDGAVLLQLR